jgi:hypothetical protein
MESQLPDPIARALAPFAPKAEEPVDPERFWTFKNRYGLPRPDYAFDTEEEARAYLARSKAMEPGEVSVVQVEIRQVDGAPPAPLIGWCIKDADGQLYPCGMRLQPKYRDAPMIGDTH